MLVDNNTNKTVKKIKISGRELLVVLSIIQTCYHTPAGMQGALRQRFEISGIAKLTNLKKSKITVEVGGWVQVSLVKHIIGKSSQNCPIYYCLSVPSMSVIGLQKKLFGEVGGWVVGVSFVWGFL